MYNFIQQMSSNSTGEFDYNEKKKSAYKVGFFFFIKALFSNFVAFYEIKRGLTLLSR
jgi:hypothetical protein